MKYYFIFLILGIGAVHSLLAQVDSLSEVLNESVEEDNGLVELFNELQQNPSNINIMDGEDLRIFPFLTESDIDSILANRPFNKKRQVRQLLDKDTYRLFRPFFIAEPLPQLLNIQYIQRNYLPMYTVKGIKENKFRGNNIDNYSRIRFSTSQNISGGLLIQKDLGENEITDHYSGFLQWETQKLKIILGNYRVQFGHGLIMDSPYALQKSIFTLAPFRVKNLGGRHYLSSSEIGGFNGIFAGYAIHSLVHFYGFYANTLRDGNLNDNKQYVTGIYNSGYHRTKTEDEKKELIREKTLGGTILYTFSDQIETALCAAAVNYNPSIQYNSLTQSENELRRNHFQFSGEQISLYSLFLNTHFETIEFSSEISTNLFNLFSHSYNILFPTNKGGIGFKWWHISKQFQSPFGHSFATASNFPQARQGYYFGLQQQIIENVICSSYWTSEKDLWRTYFNPMPTISKDFLINFAFDVADKTNVIFRYQFSDNNFYNSDFPTAFSEYRRKLRLDFIKYINKNIRVRSRIEKIFINYSDYLTKQEGTNLYQDISWQVSQLLNIRARFSSFVTDDYDSRIYEFENDLPGTFSNYALSGKGTKWYLLLRLYIFENLRLWIKYRTIYYDGVDSIGSGDLQSEGNTRQDLRIQFSYSY